MQILIEWQIICRIMVNLVRNQNREKQWYLHKVRIENLKYERWVIISKEMNRIDFNNKTYEYK